MTPHNSWAYTTGPRVELQGEEFSSTWLDTTRETAPLFRMIVRTLKPVNLDAFLTASITQLARPILFRSQTSKRAPGGVTSSFRPAISFFYEWVGRVDIYSRALRMRGQCGGKQEVAILCQSRTSCNPWRYNTDTPRLHSAGVENSEEMKGYLYLWYTRDKF